MLRGSEYFCESQRTQRLLALIISMTFPDGKNAKIFRNSIVEIIIPRLSHCFMLSLSSIILCFQFPSVGHSSLRYRLRFGILKARGGNLGSPWDELLTKIVVTHCLSQLFVALLLTRGAFLVIGSRLQATEISWKYKSMEIITQPRTDYRDPRLRDGGNNHEAKT